MHHEALQFLRVTFARLIGVPVDQLDDAAFTLDSDDPRATAIQAVSVLMGWLELPKVRRLGPAQLAELVEEIVAVRATEPNTTEEQTLAALIAIVERRRRHA